MRLFFGLLILTLFVGCSLDIDPTSSPSTSRGRVNLPRVNCSISAPNGFVYDAKLNTSLPTDRIWNHDLGVGIIVHIESGKDADTYVAHCLALPHNLLSHEKVTISGAQGDLIHVEWPEQGKRNYHLFVDFPDGMLNAQAPYKIDEAGHIEGAIRDSMKSIERG